MICRLKDKKWDSRKMLSSGGIPSSHSATVTALATAIGLEGVGGGSFAIAVVLACVVMYDATGVRLHAGRQAEFLNQIVCELPPEHPVATSSRFTRPHSTAGCCRCYVGMYGGIPLEK